MVAETRTLARFKTRARILKASAHPSRLRIVEEFSRNERCVCEPAARGGAERPTVSRHLAQLREAGLVENDKRGVQVFYRLHARRVLDLIRHVKAVKRARTGGDVACGLS